MTKLINLMKRRVSKEREKRGEVMPDRRDAAAQRGERVSSDRSPGSASRMAEDPAEHHGKLRRHQEPRAHRGAAHRLRGGALSQSPRVLGNARHGQLHDPRGHLHPPLPVLRGGDRAARRGGQAGAASGCRGRAPHGSEARPRDHGEPRRPAGRRGVGDGGHRPRHPRARSRNARWRCSPRTSWAPAMPLPPSWKARPRS